MNDVGFPLGFIIVLAGGACFLGVSTSIDAAKTRAFGLGLLGAFLAFAALLIAVAIS